MRKRINSLNAWCRPPPFEYPDMRWSVLESKRVYLSSIRITLCYTINKQAFLSTKFIILKMIFKIYLKFEIREFYFSKGIKETRAYFFLQLYSTMLLKKPSYRQYWNKIDIFIPFSKFVIPPVVSSILMLDPIRISAR